MTTQPEALRLADALDGCSGPLLPITQAAAELRRLHAENKALRSLLIEDAEWLDKRIHPSGGETYQNWKLRVYLPVPLSEKNKSVEQALNAAIDAARSKT